MSQESASPHEAVFEQLLRLAASYGPNRSEPVFRKGPFSEDIALRAYHNYLNRGATNGRDLDDWLQAEREVIDELKRNRTSLRLALAFGVLKDSTENSS